MSQLTRNEILIHLMSECAEVIHAASKCIQFGYERTEANYGKNDEVLAKEIGDVLGLIDGLHSFNDIIMETSRSSKLRRAQEAKDKYGNIDK